MLGSRRALVPIRWQGKVGGPKTVGVREANRVGEPNVLLKKMVQDNEGLAPGESLPSQEQSKVAMFAADVHSSKSASVT